MVPKKSQIEKAAIAYSILKKYAICYIAMQERTGKTLTSILVAEQCNIKSVLIVTKRKAYSGWIDTLKQFDHEKLYTVTTYGKLPAHSNFDLVILDEAHNYISSYPKLSSTWKKLAPICAAKPIIYISATPYPQGYQQLYHQLALSSWSPWKAYTNFYKWFRIFGIAATQYIGQRKVTVYTETNKEKCKSSVQHLFVTGTRQELGFKYEPTDKLHYVTLNSTTVTHYNELIKHKCFVLPKQSINTNDDLFVIADTKSLVRVYAHMLEGGTLKVENTIYDIHCSTEKIDFIKLQFGDSADLAIFYHFQGEKLKLEKHFKKAAILQASAYAEGVDLSHIKTIVVYSQDYSTARYTQRRARQASMHRTEEIVVHFLLVKGAISEQCYKIVSENKRNFVDSVFEETTL